MEKWICYHSPLCPDCPPVTERLEAAGVDVEYVEITRSIAELKRFLALRDRHAAFDSVRAGGSVGIPALVRGDGEAVYFGLDEVNLDSLPVK